MSENIWAASQVYPVTSFPADMRNITLRRRPVTFFVELGSFTVCAQVISIGGRAESACVHFPGCVALPSNLTKILGIYFFQKSILL